MNQFLLALPAFFLTLFSVHCQLLVVVTPPDSQLVPQNSLDNVTYLCNVTSGNSDPLEAVWAVGRTQLSSTARRLAFADSGVFVEDIEDGVARLILTATGRVELNGTIIVQCFGTIFRTELLPLTIPGDALSVVSFGPPTGPPLMLELRVGQTLNDLVLTWMPPSKGLVGVAQEYEVAVTGLSVAFTNTTNQTSVLIRNPTTDCQPHTFSVRAANLAGPGPLAIINRTIPIAPDLTSLNEGFTISSVTLSTPILLFLNIPVATTCSEEFGITNYSLVAENSGVFLPVLLGNGSSFAGGNVQVRVAAAANLQVNLFIQVCISITCKNSVSQLLRTSATQEASLEYFANNIFMTCVLASGSTAVGCRFILRVGNVSEEFDLEGGAPSVTQCNQTMSVVEIFDSVVVVDLLPMAAGPLVLAVTPSSLPDSSTFTQNTSCTIPTFPTATPSSSLSAGAIVGIVMAGLLVGAAILVTVVVLVACRIKTGRWFIIKEKNKTLTVDLPKRYILLDTDDKKSKKSSSKRSGRGSGHTSPDLGLPQEQMMALAPNPSSPPLQSDVAHLPTVQETDVNIELVRGSSATVPTSLSEADEVDKGVTAWKGKARSSATAPLLGSPSDDHAVTLDISADHKKIKLHLNRPLIQRLLDEKSGRGADEKSGRGVKHKRLQHQTSYKNLPMPCQMRVGDP